MSRTRMIADGEGIGFKVQWQRNAGVHFSWKEPSDDDTRAFLTHLRPFLSEREPVFLNRIYKTFFRALTSDELREYLRESRELWSRTLKAGGFRLVHNGEEITPEEVTDLWINGWYFHSDEARRARLQRLGEPLAVLNRQLFLDHVAEAANQVLYVAGLIVFALKEGLCRFEA